MKKNLFFTAIAALLLFFGAGEANAQQKVEFDAPAMTAEVQTLAESIVNNQTDPEAANKFLKKLQSKIKGNKEQATAACKYFLEAPLYPAANICAKAAYAADPTYVPGLMAYGYVYKLRKDWGNAGAKFDEVLTQEPGNTLAMRMAASMYKVSNPYAAKDYYAKILEVDPNNVEVHKELGDIAYDQKEYTDCVSEYGLYYKGVQDKKAAGLAVWERYLMSLYLTQDYYTALDVLEVVQPLEPENIIFRRVKFFSEIENADFQAASESIKYITEKTYADSVYTTLDYNYAGRFFTEVEDAEQAIQYFRKSVEFADASASEYQNLATALHYNSQSIEAIPYYQKYLEMKGEDVKVSDEFLLGQIYSGAAKNKDITPEEKDKYVAEGDAVFAKCLELDPTNVLACINRARLHIRNTSEAEEMPKTYYEQTLQLAQGNEDYNDQVYEAARYLMFYSFKKDDMGACKKYFNIVTAIRPDDPLAAQLKKVL